ncbi:Fur family transcriptional regulator [Ferroacidibacillus organovorans]|uniref:Fur family transcriptional regulator n=1 Tax=Ferroacidibacillus organovorans TaxID=1765683 RepID=UPI0009EF5110|nr:transcriptional repressor [Ferroacidibacillus organovorans]
MDKLQIKELLNGQKFRLTSERESLLDVFASSSSMLTPSQLYELADKHDINIGLTTVYRLLEVLTKVGVATPFLVDGTIFYAYCGCEHHHHFVCLSCHRVMDIQGSCPSFDVPDNFRVSSHRSDLYGTCSDCQTANDAGCTH